MNAVWSEPTEVQGPAVQATKELHARHLLFSYQNTFSHVPPFPCSFSIPLPPKPCNIHSVNWELSLSFQPVLFKHSSLDHSSTDTPPIALSHSVTCLYNPSLHLFLRCLYLNSLGLADNPGVLPIWSRMLEPCVSDHKTAWGTSRLNLNEPHSHKQK